MTRSEFTRIKTMLLNKMIEDKHLPVEDYLMRSKYEQKRLYDAGLSKCDGTKRISRHQYGKAVDIYFVIDGKICFDYSKSQLAQKLAKEYHDYWVSLGGNPIIEWDLGHYESD